MIYHLSFYLPPHKPDHLWGYCHGCLITGGLNWGSPYFCSSPCINFTTASASASVIGVGGIGAGNSLYLFAAPALPSRMTFLVSPPPLLLIINSLPLKEGPIPLIP